MADWYTTFVAGMVVGGLLVMAVNQLMGWTKR